VYLSIVILTTGMAAEAFTPLFGQRLAGVVPLVAAFLGAAVSLGWSVSTMFAAGAAAPRTVHRLLVAGPALLAVGLTGTGLFQWHGASPATVVVWFAGLILAGTGIGIAFPHLLVAAMGSSPDKAEAGKAAAGANTVELLAVSFSSAIGGVLVNLGAPDMADSARFLLFGFAAVAVVGCLTARRVRLR
jgi:hypothetical protein